MKRIRQVGLGVCAVALYAAALAQDLAPRPAPAAPVAPTAPVAGMAQGEWAERWWQWAFSFDRALSPVADRSGERCGSRQSGDVWFLAGACGTQRVVRSCKVPAGKHLFFPLINVLVRSGDTGMDCEALVSRLAAMTDEPQALVLEIDGRRVESLQAHRMASAACFSLVPGQPPDAVANGYYVALPPLPKGQHTLNFGGILPGLAQAVTYTLIVD